MLGALCSQGGVILVVLPHFILHTGPRGTFDITNKNNIYLWLCRVPSCSCAFSHFILMLPPEVDVILPLRPLLYILKLGLKTRGLCLLQSYTACRVVELGFKFKSDSKPMFLMKLCLLT